MQRFKLTKMLMTLGEHTVYIYCRTKSNHVLYIYWEQTGHRDLDTHLEVRHRELRRRWKIQLVKNRNMSLSQERFTI